jgi:hypothetical protein
VRIASKHMQLNTTVTLHPYLTFYLYLRFSFSVSQLYYLFRLYFSHANWMFGRIKFENTEVVLFVSVRCGKQKKWQFVCPNSRSTCIFILLFKFYSLFLHSELVFGMDLWLCTYNKKREHWPSFNCRGCGSNFIQKGSNITQQLMFYTGGSKFRSVTLSIKFRPTFWIKILTTSNKRHSTFLTAYVLKRNTLYNYLFLSCKYIQNYMGTTLTDPNSIHEEIKSRLKSRNVYYRSVQSYALQCAIQKVKDWDIQKYNFAYCFVWLETLYSSLLTKSIKLRCTEL